MIDINNILNHTMNEFEVYEAHRIVDLVNKHKNNDAPPIKVGNPAITDEYTQGYTYGTIKCIKQEIGYAYYLFRVEERGCIDCVDLKQCIENMEKTYPKDIVIIDGIMHYLLISLGCERHVYYIHNRFLVKAHLDKNGLYWFEQLHSYGSGMADDEMQSCIGYGQAIYKRINCICGKEFFIPGDKIPANARYEVICPRCGMMLMRKNIVGGKDEKIK